ncbi:MAG: HlyD family efflux transporter periplasmic adaptor subunit [Acidobacteria bacterium]|nr:HlyD family efflux transporter periplasmic adaptor subunit [Acidobacteriota bacterium]
MKEKAISSENASENEPPSASEAQIVSEQPESPSGKPRRKFLKAIIPLVLIFAVGGTAIWYFFIRGSGPAVNIISVSGRIESDDSAVAVKTTGKIREINVREGDRVRAGQIIAVLDDEQLKAREEQAQAAVVQAETRLSRAKQQIAILEEQKDQSQLGVEQSKLDAQGRVKQAEAQVSQTRSQVAQAEAQLEQAEVNLKQAKYDEEKATRLFKTGDVSEQLAKQSQSKREALVKVVQAQRKQLDSARSAVNAAIGTLAVARANFANPAIRSSQSAAISKQIDQFGRDIDSAQADLERARAQFREAEANRNDLNVVAPFDGVVATRAVEPGEVVQAGTTIITLLNTKSIYLRGFVPEGEIGKVKIGQKVRIYLDSDPNNPIDGLVTRIDPEATFTPENTYFQNDRVKQVVGVKLSINDPQGFAKPGMPADGEILLAGDWPTNIRTK